MIFAKEQTDLVCKGVETDEELRLANDLMAKVHMADYFSALNWLETSGAGYPSFRREHTRIALWHGDSRAQGFRGGDSRAQGFRGGDGRAQGFRGGDSRAQGFRGGELAGSLRMNTETLRLGEARLKTGGFGWVTTEPRHRHKGVCRALVLDTLDYMRSQGYHMSLLFGIPNFYHRFGFATALADYAITVELEEAASIPRLTLRVRDAKPGDIAAIQRIHNANDADVACSTIRTCAHLTNKWAHRAKTVRVLTNDQGKVVAYLMARKEGAHVAVDEAGVSDRSLCESVLAACARLAADETVGRLQFLMPPTHPFARFLLQYRSTHEMRVTHDEGGMLAFVNLAETLESMTPEWERLVAASSLRDTNAEVTFLIDGEPHRIRAHRGAVDVAAMSGRNRVSFTAVEMICLVTGCRHVEDILASRRRILSPETRDLLVALFPRRAPYVWTFDRF